jgi:hypothetical protein
MLLAPSPLLGRLAGSWLNSVSGAAQSGPLFPRARLTGWLARGPAAPTACPASVARVRAGQLPSPCRHRWGPHVGAQAAPWTSPPTPRCPLFSHLAQLARSCLTPTQNRRRADRRAPPCARRPAGRSGFAEVSSSPSSPFPSPFPLPSSPLRAACPNPGAASTSPCSRGVPHAAARPACVHGPARARDLGLACVRGAARPALGHGAATWLARARLGPAPAPSSARPSWRGLRAPARGWPRHGSAGWRGSAMAAGARPWRPARAPGVLRRPALAAGARPWPRRGFGVVRSPARLGGLLARLARDVVAWRAPWRPSSPAVARAACS